MMRHHIHKSHDPKRRLSLMIPQDSPVPDERRRCSINESNFLLPPMLSNRRSSYGDISPKIILGEKISESEFKFNEHRRLSSAFVNDSNKQSVPPSDGTGISRRRSSIYSGELKRLEQETEASTSTVRNFVSVVVIIISLVVAFSFYQLVYV